MYNSVKIEIEDGMVNGMTSEEVISVAEAARRRGYLESSEPCTLCAKGECACRDGESPYVPLRCGKFELDEVIFRAVVACV